MPRPTAAVREEVVRRCGDCCEYCGIHQADAATRHQVDHIISEKHGGATELDNLALSCLPCNRRKGSDIAAEDPLTGKIERLFNPRQQDWAEHFRFEAAMIVGLTPTGRTTVAFLQLNSEERLLERTERIKLNRLRPR